MSVYEKAVFYHFIHSLGMLIVSYLPEDGHVLESAASSVCALLLVGVIIFSGSLYLLAVTGNRWLGAITPIGGLSFIAWAGCCWPGTVSAARPEKRGLTARPSLIDDISCIGTSLPAACAARPWRRRPRSLCSRSRGPAPMRSLPGSRRPSAIPPASASCACSHARKRGSAARSWTNSRWPESTVSEHLRILKEAGLVRSTEDGPRVGYCINFDVLRRLKALVAII